jgi:hypothetical protein
MTTRGTDAVQTPHIDVGPNVMGQVTDSEGLCRKFSCGEEMRAVVSVGGMIRRPGRRTVRLP